MTFRCCGETHPVGANLLRVVRIDDCDGTTFEAWVTCPECETDSPVFVSGDDAWALTLVLRHSEVFRRLRVRRTFEEIVRQSW